MRNEDENEEIKEGLYIPKKKKRTFELMTPGCAYLIFFSSLFIIPELILGDYLPKWCLFLLPLFLALFLAVDAKYERNHPKELNFVRSEDYDGDDIGAH